MADLPVMHKTAGQALHSALSAKLKAQNQRPTIRAVAKLIGVCESQWSNYAAGKFKPSTKKLDDWLVALKEQGYEVRIVTAAEGYFALGAR